MPRINRAVALNYPHHVTQRGNNRQDVFWCDEDRKYYLELVKKCLQGIALCYTQYFNHSYQRTGRL